MSAEKNNLIEKEKKLLVDMCYKITTSVCSSILIGMSF